jgi:hypothetical protein
MPGPDGKLRLHPGCDMDAPLSVPELGSHHG